MAACFFCRSSIKQVHAQLLAAEQVEIAREPLAFGDDVLAHAHQIGEIAGDRVGLRAHVRDARRRA